MLRKLRIDYHETLQELLPNNRIIHYILYMYNEWIRQLLY